MKNGYESFREEIISRSISISPIAAKETDSAFEEKESTAFAA